MILIGVSVLFHPALGLSLGMRVLRCSIPRMIVLLIETFHIIM